MSARFLEKYFESVECKKCLRLVKKDYNYCPHCGSELERFHYCGGIFQMEIPANSEFCPHCGAKVGQQEEKKE